MLLIIITLTSPLPRRYNASRDVHHNRTFYFLGKSKTTALSWRPYNPGEGGEGPANNYFQMKCLLHVSHVSGALYRP